MVRCRLPLQKASGYVDDSYDVLLYPALNDVAGLFRDKVRALIARVHVSDSECLRFMNAIVAQDAIHYSTKFQKGNTVKHHYAYRSILQHNSTVVHDTRVGG